MIELYSITKITSDVDQEEDQVIPFSGLYLDSNTCHMIAAEDMKEADSSFKISGISDLSVEYVNGIASITYIFTKITSIG
jgi:hypothetical protein